MVKLWVNHHCFSGSTHHWKLKPEPSMPTILTMIIVPFGIPPDHFGTYTTLNYQKDFQETTRQVILIIVILKVLTSFRIWQWERTLSLKLKVKKKNIALILFKDSKPDHSLHHNCFVIPRIKLIVKEFIFFSFYFIENI